MLGILGALIGQFPALLKSGLDYFTTRNSAEIQKIGAGRDVAIATLQAQVAVNQAKAALLQSRRFVFLLFLLYMPVLLHAMPLEIYAVTTHQPTLSKVAAYAGTKWPPLLVIHGMLCG